MDVRTGDKGVWIGLITYIVLSVTKIVVGWLTQSEALKADGFNNASDIVTSITVLIALHFSRKPADLDHTYGHRRVEMIGALLASFIMATLGIQVLIQSITTLFSNNVQTPDPSAAIVAFASAFILFLVYRYNRNLAKKINSQAVMAAAKDQFSDALVSIGAGIGILCTQFGAPWLDPLVSLIIGIIICKTAWDIFAKATHTLTDGYDPKQIEQYRDVIRSIKGVLEVRNIKARSDGKLTYLDIVITVDPYINVIESHAISEAIEKELEQRFSISYVVVHVEPRQSNTPPS